MTRAAFKPVTAVLCAEPEIVGARGGGAKNKYLNINDLKWQSLRVPD
jgi:hypothetical protein